MANVRRSSLCPVHGGSIYLTDMSQAGLRETHTSRVQPQCTTPSDSDDEEEFNEDGKTNSRAGPATNSKQHNSGATLAEIKRRQRRRSRVHRRHFVANCLRLGLTFLYYVGLSSVRPKPLPKTFVWIQKVSIQCSLTVNRVSMKTYTSSFGKFYHDRESLFFFKPHQIHPQHVRYNSQSVIISLL